MVQQLQGQSSISELETTTPPRAAFASTQTVRQAILDVLDEGCTCFSHPHPWDFHHGDMVGDINQTRLDFCETIVARILELQAAGLGTRLELLCDRHKRIRLPEPPENTTCADCERGRR